MQAGLVPQGNPVTVAISAGVQALLNVNDGAICRSFTLAISNSSGSPATISNFAFLMSA